MKRISLFLILAFLLTPARAAFSEVPDLKKAKEYDAKIPIKVVREIPLPKGYHEGLFYDGQHMWVCNGEKGNIWLVDLGTGAVDSEIEPPGTFTEGVTLSGKGTFWVTDWDEKKLYRVKVEDDKMVVDYDISLEPAHPTGVVWTGKNLYVITWTRGVTGTTYHLMQMDEDERLFRKMRIKRIHEPAHLAWDGHYLWITSWYSRLVYKVDVETFRVLGSFRSPAVAPTGITWDGQYLWITGTRAGLYQVEVGKGE